MNKELKNKNSYNTLLIFMIFTIISFSMHFFHELSILKYSFKIFETFYHEIGHGYSSILLGGEVVDLHLEYNQGSVTHRTPDWAKPIVSFAGYFSASLFGFLLYASSIYISKYIKFVLVVNTAFWFFYSDGLITATILIVILGTFVASWYLKEFGCYLLRFIGVYVMVSAIYSPTYLWAYGDVGDHVSLYTQTFIPSFLWIICWFLIGVFFLYRAFIISCYKKNSST